MKKKVLLYICFALISIGGYSQISTDEIEHDEHVTHWHDYHLRDSM